MKLLRLSWLAVPVLNTAQQMFLKLGADQADTAHGSAFFEHVFLSHWFLAAVVAEIVCFIVWMSVLADLPLSKAFPLSAVSYVLIMAMAWFMFDEPVTLLTLIGTVTILTGAWCIATASKSGT
ncbi:EamA family transporter [Agrobacterium vitis]|uniref:EamA family transporter n=1 Tax=Allorhizobium ampelinum TaxID=3025782 RepID=UPI001F2DA145|nr:EamA family transporter [Allorhizobium ampelinum]MCF1460819.1 EamA family transporter [Allorhizobium ampelinum]